MTTAQTVYKMWAPGQHRRPHNSGGFVNAPAGYGQPANDSVPITSGSYWTINAPPKWQVGANQYATFAFINVTGNVDDNHFFGTPTEPGGTNHHVEVGDQPVTAMVVYVLFSGGPGPCGGVRVDAFDQDTNVALDNDFMSVIENGSVNTVMSGIANEDGIVSSARQEDLRAYDHIGSRLFRRWELITPPVDPNFPSNTVIEDRDYTMQADECGVLFAFFQTPADYTPPKQYILDKVHQDIYKTVAAEFNWGPGPLEDPSWGSRMENRLKELEAKVGKVAIFMKAEQRPVVGKEIMNQAKKTKKK